MAPWGVPGVRWGITQVNLVLHQKFTECLPCTRCALCCMLRIKWWVTHSSCLQEASALSLMGLGFNTFTTLSELGWIYRWLPEPLVLLESSQLRLSLPWFSPLPKLLFKKSSAGCNRRCFNAPAPRSRSHFPFHSPICPHAISMAPSCYILGVCVCLCMHTWMYCLPNKSFPPVWR